MTIRKILVPLTGSERDQGALATAFSFARWLDAHVEGLFVRPDPTETLPYMGEGVAGPVIQDIMNAAREAADQASGRASSMLYDAAGAAGVPLVDRPHGPGQVTASFAEDTGHFSDIVANHSMLADLVLFVSGSDDEGTGLGDALQDCLMSGGRPILLAPTTPATAPGNIISIGWDGSAEAALAIRTALPFLSRANAIHVLNVRSGRIDTELNDRLSAYLAYHGLEASEHVIQPEGRAIGEVLLSESEKCGSNLLVMGGYGHSRIRELLLGGVTRHVLSHSSIPVLMVH